MAEETKTVETAPVTTEAQIAPPVSPFSSTAWQETPVEVEAKPVVTKTESTTTTAAPASTATTTQEEEEILDPSDYLKREVGVENIDDIKQRLKELEELKKNAQTPAEKQFANEQSKLAYEALLAGEEDKVYEILSKKRKLSAADKLEASKLLKLSIEQANPHYKEQDIEDVYEEKYALPRKPIQATDELEDEYNERVSQWQTEVDKINRRIERDAYLAKEQLAKLNFELKFPEATPKIDPQQAEKQQKELEHIAELRNQYTTALESEYKKFNGFEVRYKGEDVEIPVNFSISDEDKTALRGELENFDVDGFIMDRWFDEKGQPKITQMMEDVTLLRKKEAVFQKIANEVGDKMKEHYYKIKSNVNVTGNNQYTFQPQQQNGASADPFKSTSWKEVPASN